MVDTHEIRVLMTKKNLSGVDVAKALHITPKTFYTKMKTGLFDSEEMTILISLLDIKEPIAVFFATKVSK